MVKNMVETLANCPGFSVTVHSCGSGDIELGSDDARRMPAIAGRVDPPVDLALAGGLVAVCMDEGDAELGAH